MRMVWLEIELPAPVYNLLIDVALVTGNESVAAFVSELLQNIDRHEAFRREIVTLTLFLRDRPTSQSPAP